MQQTLRLSAPLPAACSPRRGIASRRTIAAPPSAFLNFLFRKPQAAEPKQSAQQAAVERLLSAVEGTERGLDKSNRQEVLEAAASLAELGNGSTTTGAEDLSATWRLLWTTEQETLFILQRAGLFGTAAGEVYQVIDVEQQYLQNVITFPPEDGAFIVDSGISISGPQRTDFKFEAATLKLPAGRRLRLPPFGKGWFDTVFVDGDSGIRVAQDSRGDTLVVVRDGPPRRFS